MSVSPKDYEENTELIYLITVYTTFTTCRVSCSGLVKYCYLYSLRCSRWGIYTRTFQPPRMFLLLPRAASSARRDHTSRDASIARHSVRPVHFTLANISLHLFVHFTSQLVLCFLQPLEEFSRGERQTEVESVVLPVGRQVSKGSLYKKGLIGNLSS